MDRHVTIAQQRLHGLLEGPAYGSPEEAVTWLTAVQSQEFGLALWSVAQRLADADEPGLSDAFDAGRLLRTHVLRPTWHFVTPDDIRWLLTATAPRVHMANGFLYRQQELDDVLLAGCTELIADALRGGVQLTRKQIGEHLARAGIVASGVRLGLIMMYAELEAVVCSGARQGKQHTYALLEERAPKARHLDPEQAVVELVRRYLASHGPATDKDLRAWSSLRVRDLRPAFEELATELATEEYDGRTYWFLPPVPQAVPAVSPTVHLVQPYDEYVMGYLDSRHVVDLAGRGGTLHPDAVLPNAIVLLDGQLAGHWRRTLTQSTVTIQVLLYAPFDDQQMSALQAAAAAHGTFLGRDAQVVVEDEPPVRQG